MNCKTINKTIKQMLALLLAVAMVATSFSVPVKAAEGEDPIDESIVVAEETVEETAVEADQSVENAEITEEGEQAPIEEEPAVEAVEETAVGPEETEPAAWTPSTSVIGVAPSVDRSTGTKVEDDYLLDSSKANVTVTVDEENDHKATITVTPKQNTFILKPHMGEMPKGYEKYAMGHWAGVYFKAPDNATKYKAATLNSLNDIPKFGEEADPIKTNIANPDQEDPKGATYYLNLGVSKTAYYAIKWVADDDSESDAYIFEINMNGVSLAPSSIEDARSTEVKVAESKDTENAVSDSKQLLGKDNATVTLEGTTITVRPSNDEDKFTALASHTGAGEVGKGYWAGIAIKAPVAVTGENPEYAGYRVGFPKSLSDENYKVYRSSLEKYYETDNYGAVIYFDLGASKTNYVALQWYNDKGEIGPTTKYTVNMEDVTIEADNSLNWTPSTAAGSANISVAPSVDTTSVDPETKGMLNKTDATAAYTDSTKTITVTARDEGFVLRKHKNEQDKAGYWAGVALEAPTGATGYRVALLNSVSDTNRNYMKSPELDTIDGQKKYATIYLELGTSKTQAIAIKWIKDGSVGSECVLNIDMTGIKIPSDIGEAYAPSDKNIIVAPSVDVDGKVTSGMLNTSNATLTYTAAKKTIKVTPEQGFKLNKHKRGGADPTTDYWAGVFFEAPTGVNGYKAKFIAAADLDDDVAIEGEPSALESTTTKDDKDEDKEITGVGAYAKLAARDKVKYFALQWTIGKEAIGDPEIFTLDFSDVDLNDKGIYKVTATSSLTYITTSTTADEVKNSITSPKVQRYDGTSAYSYVKYSDIYTDLSVVSTDQTVTSGKTVPVLWSRNDLAASLSLTKDKSPKNGTYYYLLKLVDKDGKAIDFTKLEADKETAIYLAADLMEYQSTGADTVITSQAVESAKLGGFTVKKGLKVAAKAAEITFVKSDAEAELKKALNPTVTDDGKSYTSEDTTKTVFWTGDGVTRPTSGNYYNLSYTFKLITDGVPVGDPVAFASLASGSSYQATITAARKVKNSTTSSYDTDAEVTTTCIIKVCDPAAPYVKETYNITEGSSIKDLQTMIGKQISVKGAAPTTPTHIFWSDAAATSVTAAMTDYYVLKLSLVNDSSPVETLESVAADTELTATVNLYKGSHASTSGSYTYSSAEWDNEDKKQGSATATITIVKAFQLSVVDQQAGKLAASINITKGSTSANFIASIKAKVYGYKEDTNKTYTEGGQTKKDHYADTVLSSEWDSKAVQAKNVEAHSDKYVISSTPVITDDLLKGLSFDITITATRYINNTDAAKKVSELSSSKKQETVTLTVNIIDEGGFDGTYGFASDLWKITVSNKPAAAMLEEISAKFNGKVTAGVRTASGVKAEKLLSRSEVEKKKKSGLYPEGDYYVWDITNSFPVTDDASLPLQDKYLTIQFSHYKVAKGGAESLGTAVHTFTPNKAEDTHYPQLTVTPRNGYFNKTAEGDYIINNGTLYKADGSVILDDILLTIKNSKVLAWEDCVKAGRALTLTGKPASAKGKKAGQVLGYSYELKTIAGLDAKDLDKDKKDAIIEAINKGITTILVTYDVVSYVAAEKTVDGKTTIEVEELVKKECSDSFTVTDYNAEGAYTVNLYVLSADGTTTYYENKTITVAKKGHAVFEYLPKDTTEVVWTGVNAPAGHTTKKNYITDYSWFDLNNGTAWDIFSTPINDTTNLYTHEIEDVVVKTVGEGDNEVEYSIQPIPEAEYSGQKIIPTVMVFRNNEQITSGVKVTFKQGNKSVTPKNAGTYDVYVTIGSGKTKVELNKATTFKINKTNIRKWDAGFAEQSVVAKNGKGSLGLIKSYKANKVTLKLGTDYTYAILDKDDNVKYNANSNKKAELAPGKYTILVTALGKSTNFTEGISFTRMLYVYEKNYILKNAKVKTVGKAVLQRGGTMIPVTVTFGDKTTGTYDPVVSGADGDMILSGTNDKLHVTYSNYTDAGKATIEITAKDTNTKYQGTKTITYNISAAKGKKLSSGMVGSKSILKSITKSKDIVYTGKAWTLEKYITELVPKDEVGTSYTVAEAVEVITKSVNGPIYGRDYLVTYSNNTKAGKATVLFKAEPNSGYTGSFKLTFKIAKPSISDMDGDDARFGLSFGDTTTTKIFAGENDDFTPVVSGKTKKYVLTKTALDTLIDDTVSGYYLLNDTDYTVSYKGNNDTNKKNMTITIKGKGNYQGKKVITITPATAE